MAFGKANALVASTWVSFNYVFRFRFYILNRADRSNLCDYCTISPTANIVKKTLISPKTMTIMTIQKRGLLKSFFITGIFCPIE
jgi:hypothetical protein